MGQCPWLGASAIDAWNRWPDRRVQQPQIGDFVFYAANVTNENYGHVGVVIGPDLMESVTFYGTRQDSISHWSATYAGLLGYQRWWS